MSVYFDVIFFSILPSFRLKFGKCKTTHRFIFFKDEFSYILHLHFSFCFCFWVAHFVLLKGFTNSNCVTVHKRYMEQNYAEKYIHHNILLLLIFFLLFTLTIERFIQGWIHCIFMTKLIDEILPFVWCEMNRNCLRIELTWMCREQTIEQHILRSLSINSSIKFIHVSPSI